MFDANIVDMLNTAPEDVPPMSESDKESLGKRMAVEIAEAIAEDDHEFWTLRDNQVAYLSQRWDGLMTDEEIEAALDKHLK